MNYKNKYLKYKNKYLKLSNKYIGGSYKSKKQIDYDKINKYIFHLRSIKISGNQRKPPDFNDNEYNKFGELDSNDIYNTYKVYNNDGIFTEPQKFKNANEAEIYKEKRKKIDDEIDDDDLDINEILELYGLESYDDELYTYDKKPSTTTSNSTILETMYSDFYNEKISSVCIIPSLELFKFYVEEYHKNFTGSSYNIRDSFYDLCKQSKLISTFGNTISDYIDILFNIKMQEKYNHNQQKFFPSYLSDHKPIILNKDNFILISFNVQSDYFDNFDTEYKFIYDNYEKKQFYYYIKALNICNLIYNYKINYPAHYKLIITLQECMYYLYIILLEILPIILDDENLRYSYTFQNVEKLDYTCSDYDNYSTYITNDNVYKNNDDVVDGGFANFTTFDNTSDSLPMLLYYKNYKADIKQTDTEQTYTDQTDTDTKQTDTYTKQTNTVIIDTKKSVLLKGLLKPKVYSISSNSLILSGSLIRSCDACFFTITTDNNIKIKVINVHLSKEYAGLDLFTIIDGNVSQLLKKQYDSIDTNLKKLYDKFETTYEQVEHINDPVHDPVHDIIICGNFNIPYDKLLDYPLSIELKEMLKQKKYVFDSTIDNIDWILYLTPPKYTSLKYATNENIEKTPYTEEPQYTEGKPYTEEPQYTEDPQYIEENQDTDTNRQDTEEKQAITQKKNKKKQKKKTSKQKDQVEEQTKIEEEEHEKIEEEEEDDERKEQKKIEEKIKSMYEVQKIFETIKISNINLDYEIIIDKLTVPEIEKELNLTLINYKLSTSYANKAYVNTLHSSSQFKESVELYKKSNEKFAFLIVRKEKLPSEIDEKQKKMIKNTATINELGENLDQMKSELQREIKPHMLQVKIFKLNCEMSFIEDTVSRIQTYIDKYKKHKADWEQEIEDNKNEKNKLSCNTIKTNISKDTEFKKYKTQLESGDIYPIINDICRNKGVVPYDLREDDTLERLLKVADLYSKKRLCTLYDSENQLSQLQINEVDKVINNLQGKLREYKKRRTTNQNKLLQIQSTK